MVDQHNAAAVSRRTLCPARWREHACVLCRAAFCVRAFSLCVRAALAELCGWAGVSALTHTRAPPPIAGPADVSGVRVRWRLAGR